MHDSSGIERGLRSSQFVQPGQRLIECIPQNGQLVMTAETHSRRAITRSGMIENPGNPTDRLKDHLPCSEKNNGNCGDGDRNDADRTPKHQAVGRLRHRKK